MNNDELNRHIAALVKTVPPPPSVGRWRQSAAETSRRNRFGWRPGRPWPSPAKALGAVAALAVALTTATVSVALTVGHGSQQPSSPPAAAVLPSTAVSLPVSSPSPAATVTPSIASPTPAASAQPTPSPSPTTSTTATATPTPVYPAWPAPPLITPDGHGGFILHGTGSDWWHLAYNTVNYGAGLDYSYPDIPAGTTDVTIPAKYKCLSVQPTKGGDQYPGHPNRYSGNWSNWFCN